MTETSLDQRRLVVVGGGMVAHRLVEAMRDRDTENAWHVDVFAEESRPPYDRVALTTFFSGRDPEDLLLGSPELWRGPGVRLHTNSPVRGIDTEDTRGARPRPDLRVRRAGARHRLLGSGPAGPGRRPAGQLRLPHGRRRHRAARVGHRP